MPDYHRIGDGILELVIKNTIIYCYIWSNLQYWLEYCFPEEKENKGKCLNRLGQHYWAGASVWDRSSVTKRKHSQTSMTMQRLASGEAVKNSKYKKKKKDKTNKQKQCYVSQNNSFFF